jgi:hypothetical protein
MVEDDFSIEGVAPAGYVPPTQGSGPPSWTVIAPPQSGGGGLQTTGVAAIDHTDYLNMSWTDRAEHWKAVNEGGNMSITIHATNSTGQHFYFTPMADFYPYHADGYSQNDGSGNNSICSTPNNNTIDLAGNHWIYNPLFPIGSTTVTCTVTDSGSTSSVSFIVTVVDTSASSVDTTLPVLTFTTGGFGGMDTEILSGGLLTVQVTNSTGQNAYFGVLANGEHSHYNNFNINTACSASPEPTYTTRVFLHYITNEQLMPPRLEDNPSSWWMSGATFPIGNTTVTCT